MSEGLEALELGNWQAARSALNRASALRPEAPEVADAVARLEAGQRREALSNAIRRAREFEETEAWGDAEHAYSEILAVDPESARALEGRGRAAIRADLDQKLQYHIQYPDRMSSPQVLEDASAVLEEARGVEPSGPKLAAQINNLEQLIEIASKPIPVVLESDNMTEVVVYRHGKLGSFSRRELKLRPGTYTAVGSRAGYRDVRVRFQVSPNSSSNVVMIRCSEPL
jgi:tetratricopeptide (TPR) repeat protein